MYHRSRETTRKIPKDEEWYFTVLLLKASTFHLVSHFLEKIFPNTIMGEGMVEILYVPCTLLHALAAMQLLPCTCLPEKEACFIECGYCIATS